MQARMGVHIRRAAEGDEEALVEQFWELNRYEDPITGDRRTGRAAAAQSLAAASRRVERAGGARLVAEVDGHVVGHLFLTFEKDEVYVRDELRTFAYIAELYVRKAQRRRGVGRALVVEAERIAIARGIRRLRVGVLTGNAPAERAYADYGFRPYALELVKPIGRPEPR
jgi:GNAT superfamily N-acetyltransferase